MAVDSSALLTGAAPIDVAGSMDRGNKILQNRITTQDMQQEAGDKQVIRDLASVPGVDFTTPKGIGEFMGHLQGRVNPDTILKLGDMKTKMEAAENARVVKLATLGDRERAQYDDTIDMTMSAFDGVDKIENSDERKAEIAKRLESYRGKTTPSGQPVYSDQAIESLQQMPWEQQLSIYKGSKHAKELSIRAKEEAETLKATQLAAESKFRTENPDVGEQYTSPSFPGKAYLKGKRGMFEINTETGEKIPVAALPADAAKTGSAQAAKSLPGAANTAVTPENLAWIADYEQRLGKPIPGIPAGTGSAASATRAAYLNAFVDLARKRGYSGEEAGELALTRDASKEAMKSMTTKNANIASGEKDITKVAVVIDDELRKLGGPDSPVVRRYWNKASTEWAGDPDFAGLNAALTNFKETAARVYSNQSGAGGTPVTYLKLAEDSIGANPTLAQFAKTREVMDKLFKAREDSNREVIMNLREQGRMTDKSAGAPKAVEADTGTPAISSPDDARKELMKARESYRTATDPAQKEMAGKAVAALEKQVGGGADKPKPTQKDLDYLAAHPDQKANFEKRFGAIK